MKQYPLSGGFYTQPMFDVEGEETIWEIYEAGPPEPKLLIALRDSDINAINDARISHSESVRKFVEKFSTRREGTDSQKG